MTDVQIALAEERFPYEGKDIILEPPSYDTHRDYTNYLDKLAIEGMIRQKKAWGDEYREARADLAQRLHTVKVNDWGSALWAESTGADDNKEYLCFLAVRQRQPNMTESAFHAIFHSPSTVLNAETGEEEEIKLGLKMFIKLKEWEARPNLSRPQPVAGQ